MSFWSAANHALESELMGLTFQSSAQYLYIRVETKIPVLIFAKSGNLVKFDENFAKFRTDIFIFAKIFA